MLQLFYSAGFWLATAMELSCHDISQSLFHTSQMRMLYKTKTSSMPAHSMMLYITIETVLQTLTFPHTVDQRLDKNVFYYY